MANELPFTQHLMAKIFAPEDHARSSCEFCEEEAAE